MAEKVIVSPGVFTNERDLSFLPQGIGLIGGAIVGPTQKGRAFIPTKCQTNPEFTIKYGGKTDESYVPFCVESYLQSAGVITVVRILSMTGYQENVIPLIINTSTGSFLAAVLHPSRTVDNDAAFKQTFLESASFSSSYNAYSYIGSAMTSFDVTIDRGGSILASGFYGTTDAASINGATAGTIVSASGADIYVSGSISGSATTAIGLKDGVAFTGSSAIFTGSNFAGHLGGGIAIKFNTNPIFSGSVSSTTNASGTFGATSGRISGSVLSGASVLASFTSSIAPISSGAAFVNAGNIIFAEDFYFQLSENLYPVSLDPTSANYIGKLFGYNAKTTLFNNFADDKDRAYNYILFESNLTNLLTIDPNATVSTASVNINLNGYQYSSAATPWITSQIISGKARNLFQIVTLSDGNHANIEIKVGIANILHSGEVGGTDYGQFDIIIRSADDTDKQQSVLESFTGLNLDNTSPNYISRVIGDKFPEFSVDSLGLSRITMKGDWNNNSNYIRIVVDDNVKFKAYDPTLIPGGFKAYKTPFDATDLSNLNITIPPVDYMITQVDNNGDYNSRVYHGFNFTFLQNDNENYLNPIPSGSTTGSNTDFNLDFIYGNVDSGYTGSIGNINSFLSQRKFIVAFQGGFDGMSPSRPKLTGGDILNTNTMGFDCSTAASAGSKLYRNATSLLSNADEYDINLYLTPGIIKQLHPSVINTAIEMCEGREDVFYIFDLAKLTEIQLDTLAGLVMGMDTNYAATYHPWLKILNTDTNQNLWVPPSTLLAGVIAYNDKIGYEWYAPAGLNRGGLTEAIDIYTKLYQTDRDFLYRNRINPIASFPNEGIAVWGQKTLQVKASALDRISVRRLLIALKKYIASATKYLVFEQNTSATRNKFLNIVNPYMESVQQRQGLYTFKVVMDESNNTSDVIDRNKMLGSVFLQPSKTAEMIIIDFNIMPTGATFAQ